MNTSVKVGSDTTFPVTNIYCVGRNYRAHAQELNHDISKNPFFFQKSLPALNTGRQIHCPEGRMIHHELEIVLLIGTESAKIPEEKAMDYVEGMALGLDLTDRPMQSEFKEKQLPWLLSKSFAGSAVVTRFIKPVNFPMDECFWLKINGKEKQRGHCNQMIFSFEYLISYLSHHIPLMRGDIIYTGTPEGVGQLFSRDKVEIGIGVETLGDYDVS